LRGRTEWSHVLEVRLVDIGLFRDEKSRHVEAVVVAGDAKRSVATEKGEKRGERAQEENKFEEAYEMFWASISAPASRRARAISFSLHRERKQSRHQKKEERRKWEGPRQNSEKRGTNPKSAESMRGVSL
jgi:hypothetical protein